MIRRYDFGTPITTGAVVQKLEVQHGEVPFMTVEKGEEGLSFRISMQEEDLIFGLGEQVRGMNKRGHLYKSWALDDGRQNEGRNNLYAGHNLLVFVQKDRVFGVYFDDPGLVTFDLGYTRMDEAVITSESGDISVYVLEEKDAVTVCRSFRKLTGSSYVPPRWAMGYIQSRWGYASADDMREVTKEHRDRHIPLDGICVDIDYMDEYRDFSWNHENFPDMEGLNAELKEKNVRLIPIIDAGVKLEEGYDVCDEGLKNDYFCKKADGTPFVGAVWPGRSLFPDFLKAETRKWFGRQYHRLMKTGIEGFWNDMNEPALFYSDESLQEAFEKLDTLRGQNLGIQGCFDLRATMLGIANNEDDYKRFYQEVDGRTVCHHNVHNLYGAHMTRATAEGFEEFDPDKRFLVFGRSSFVGMHRYGGVWQGDNASWWSHILMNLREMPSMNMVGFLYTGADIGGFSENVTADLLIRWLQLGVFTPLMRNHSCEGTRLQEVYRFENWEHMRDVITVRYALLPYLYSELMQAALNDDMMFRPLAFDYPDDVTACHTEDQVMLGHDCMIAPVYEQNATGRHVYLPEDMLMIRFTSATEYECIPVPQGHCWINLNLNQFPLFIRKNHVIPLAAPAECTADVDATKLSLLGWVESDTEVHTALYNDDGFTKHPDLASGLTAIRVIATEENVTAEAEGIELDVQGIMVD